MLCEQPWTEERHLKNFQMGNLQLFGSRKSENLTLSTFDKGCWKYSKISENYTTPATRGDHFKPNCGTT